MEVLLLQKNNDLEYFSLHIILNNNITYISYIVRFSNSDLSIKDKTIKKVKSNGFKSLLKEKKYNLDDFDFNNIQVKIINFNNLM